MQLFDMDCQVISDEVEARASLKTERPSIEAERASLQIPIRVSAYDEGRGEFVEDSLTTAITRWGGRIVLKNWVYPQDIVRIVNLDNLFEADFRVVGLAKYAELGGAEWVVECLEKGRNIWNVTFPPKKPAVVCEPGVPMECRACHSQEIHSLMPPESEVLKTSGLVGCYCGSCGKPTYWTFTEERRRPPAYPPFEDVALPPRLEKACAFINTRTHRRLTLQLPITIRNAKGEEESSTTVNISRAGFAAILAMSLAEGEMVNFVCAQFAGGALIEMKAECRWGSSVSAGATKHIYGFRMGIVGGAYAEVTSLRGEPRIE
jgi:PilZ domain